MSSRNQTTQPPNRSTFQGNEPNWLLPKMRKRNLELELLRFLCILSIVGYWHMFNYTEAFPQYKNIFTIRIIWIILAVFAFLSGYFTGKANIELSKKSLYLFFRKRLTRIYPLYLLALILFSILNINTLGTSIKASLLISMFFKPAPPTLWFINMLLIFHILSPFLADQIKKGHLYRLLGIFILSSGVLLVSHLLFKNVDFRIITYFPAYLFGIIISLKGDNYINKKICFFVFIAGTFISLLLYQNRIQVDRLSSIFMLTTAPYFIFLFFKKKITIPDKLKLLILNLSFSSYCMYLFHRPIYIITTKVYFPESGFLQILYLVFFSLPCIIIFSYFVQKTYDKLTT
jgi:peptidoglycan/LPS O-acetylase OafA/YrhL